MREPTMGLESFAALRAVLDDPFCDRATALRGVGITEAEWSDESSAWGAELARSRRLREDFAAAYAGGRARRVVLADDETAFGPEGLQRGVELPFREGDARERIEALSRTTPPPLSAPALEPTEALTSHAPAGPALPFAGAEVELSVEEHAAMVAEVSLFPQRAGEVYRRCGIADARVCAAVERRVQEVLAGDAGARARWQTAFAQASLR